MCSPDVLETALTTRTVFDKSAKKQDMVTPLKSHEAYYSRDALAKALYDRLFSWVVRVINEHIYSRGTSDKSIIGVLDIYGFEILKSNSFEQFCVNYCNEKLQQVFIELTLKQEQDEYNSEGIEWVPVKFFNNAIICQLIESVTFPFACPFPSCADSFFLSSFLFPPQKTGGLIAILDEECIRPGQATSATLLAKLNERYLGHPHYESKLARGASPAFTLKHYAGHVVYETDSFIDKNKDLLFKDLIFAMGTSKNTVIAQLFPENKKEADLKRPPSAASQFKKSMQSLMENLMSKTPHYIRCIKSNDGKEADWFDDRLCLHQVRYLGLLENVRVRRAGFCFRQGFDHFLGRYNMA